VGRPDNTDDGLDEVTRRLRAVLTDHPVAAHAAFSALVREGRAYAQTPEGEALLRRLLRSERVTRLRSAWEIVSFGTGETAPARGGALPSSTVSSFVRAALQPWFESRVHRALRSGSSPSRRGAP
jgi:hypothetical protein